MVRICVLLSLAFWCLFSANALSWSARGHSQMAIFAFSSLSEQEQGVLAPVLAAGPWSDKSGPQAHLARAAVWPDQIRDRSLNQLFAGYGSGKVPQALQPYRNQDTSQWHFVNGHFLTTEGDIVAAGTGFRSCPPRAYGQLYEVWPRLLQAYAETEDLRDKAIVLAFIVHLGADAYQPLHLMAALDSRCDHDRGGNGFCVDKSGSACRSNLHQLWDRGFGVFASDWFSPTAFDGEIARLPGSELREYAAQVYPATASAAASQAYREQSAERVRIQARSASAHLQQVLSTLAGKAHHADANGSISNAR